MKALLIIAWVTLLMGCGPPPATDDTPLLNTDIPLPTAAPALGESRIRDADGMALVYVPAGEFLMGSTDSDADASDDEKPPHTVSLAAFWIDRTEVSNAQYRRCVEARACPAPTACLLGDPTYDDETLQDHPVVCVDWVEAQAYCTWAGGRLPSEAEWEYAARGPQAPIYPWGNEYGCAHGNFDGKSCDGYAQTAPAGAFPDEASWCGACDMAGNVWEWTSDWYDKSYYARSPGDAPSGPEAGDHRVMRGGSWSTVGLHARGANRDKSDPSHHLHHLGFRCVVSAQP